MKIMKALYVSFSSHCLFWRTCFEYEYWRKAELQPKVPLDAVLHTQTPEKFILLLKQLIKGIAIQSILSMMNKLDEAT